MNFKPIILNSKMATKHLNNVMVEHNNILAGIQNQSLKVEQYNQQQQMQAQEKEQIKATNDRDILEQQNKAQELAIKEQALSI